MSAPDVAAKAADFIAKFEGFRTHAYWDTNHYRVGFGSDTTGAMMVPVRRETVETREGAIANLNLRIPRFIGAIIAQIGKHHWDVLSENEQVALIDVAYNYGHLPHSIAWACSHGDSHTLANAIVHHEHDNRSINESRRKAEAALATTETA